MSTPLQVRLPDPLRAVIKGCAKRAGQTESEAVRELIVSALSGRGLWPPQVVAIDGGAPFALPADGIIKGGAR